MPEIELLASSDSEAEEDAAAQPAVARVEVPTGDEDAQTMHPAWMGDVRIAERTLLPEMNHPAAVRVVKKDGAYATELKEQGNAKFKAKEYLEAIELYSDALDFAPDTELFRASKAVFLNNRAACLFQLGHYEDVVDDCTDAIELDPRYIKAYMRRAKALEQIDDLDAALEDLNKVVEIDPGFAPGVAEQARVERIVKAKQEQMKEEMMGKLKDLGNTVLGKFGMSLDNFQAVQDPNTGSYSISFNQNP
ncbi:Tetratricopeptide repeat protein 1 (TPR repeat protein 1) [Durusdinium trenchii]|uniref:Tetratricopeptide repeat protein 1 (TPR repeat protein 1) n=1 Tax=Durusdinium trenchii TaxID=1381693 RepID=A0ABP0KKY2_9DINO